MKKSKIFYTLIGALALNYNVINADNTVIVKLPKVPEVPKIEAVVPKVIVLDDKNSTVKSNAEILEEFTKEREVVFSDHVAPEMMEEQDDKDKVVNIGDISNGRVSAYLHAPLMDTKTVEAQLTKAGFEILNTYKVDKKGIATSIVFTNKEIVDMASKNNRGFAGALRVTIDKHNKLTSIQNPIYLMKAFMQDEYNQELAEKTLKSIRDNFTDLKDSTEIIKFRVLERFQFMEGMPRYNDMVTVKKAKNEVLYKKAKKSKKILFEQKLSNGSILLGMKLGKRTTKFVKKTGYQNAGLLPYPVLIENGEVKILDPKYYIAVMYPMLKMSQFMTISTVPGAINKEMDKIFR